VFLRILLAIIYPNIEREWRGGERRGDYDIECNLQAGTWNGKKARNRKGREQRGRVKRKKEDALTVATILMSEKGLAWEQSI
jgi:hypothetical protein